MEPPEFHSAAIGEDAFFFGWYNRYKTRCVCGALRTMVVLGAT